MRLALIVAVPLFGALLPMLLARASRKICAVGTAITTLIALTLLVTYTPEVLDGQLIEVGWDWVPQLGLSLDFKLDGLGLLMSGLILGIGLLVILYANAYLEPHEPVGVFYTYLLVFQAAMLGIALSDNALSLVVFWELTSVASFLLIGFWNHLPEGRQGARMALVVTGGGGLALTAGMLLLGGIAGTYDITEIIAHRQLVQDSPWYPLMLACILLGCFTKSAQFPFHFWLPRAMAAPTPVSAYLHSATMVKAGVFLLARLWPVLSGNEYWFYTVTTVGVLTMLLGAALATFQTDLKALMAYSTVSHLGLMTMLLGLQTQAGVVACMFHLLNHAVFKAALFMNVGIIDHGAGTRDINRLGGLVRWMPITAVAGLLAAAANAGLPPLNGFLSKEMMLEEVWNISYLGQPGVVAVVATVAGALAFAYSMRFVINVYFGDRQKLLHEPHGPSPGLAFAPTLLALAALVFGIFPGPIGEPLVESAVQASTAAEPPHLHFHLWHGMTPAVYSSIAAVMVGLLVFGRHGELANIWKRVAVVDGNRAFHATIDLIVTSCRRLTELLQSGSLPNYLVIMLVATLCGGGVSLLTSTWQLGTRPLLPVNSLSLLMGVVLLVATVAAVVYHKQRIICLLATNVVGLLTCIGFVYLSAPDLALTQIAVEVVTLILILLAMFFLPKQTSNETQVWRRWRDGILSVMGGLGMAALSWAVMRLDIQRDLANYFIDHSLSKAGGANVVNVILVDFRGFDTFSEVAVLSIAALTIYSLLDRARHGISGNKLNHWVADQPRTLEKHPKLMMLPTRLMLPMTMLAAAYLFLRGHNDPGGGFVAGLMASIALIMQYMISGYKWADQRIHIDAHAWIATGLLLVAGTSTASIVMGYPFLTNAHGHIHLPVLGDLAWSSAMAFDAGVLMAVVGALMLTLANLARMGRQAEKSASQANAVAGAIAESSTSTSPPPTARGVNPPYGGSNAMATLLPPNLEASALDWPSANRGI
ncbi:MAG: monovalent cation/H+ antiporter subunit A [Pirellulaceae bacterium]|nr:monovalent cation/H+ antiporter subunit A [Pirellulaceae bacterium]